MSPKMSSLAFDEAEQVHSRNATMDFEPELTIVKSRRLLGHEEGLSIHLDEVCYIGGRFTVSF